MAQRWGRPRVWWLRLRRHARQTAVRPWCLLPSLLLWELDGWVDLPTERSTTLARRETSRVGVLLAQDLDDHALWAPPVEFGVEDLLPGAEIEATGGHGHDHLVVHQQVLEMTV